MMNGRHSGQLFVISGPSGVGKSTVIQQVLTRMPEIYFSVSFTTRLKRPGEQNGIDYNFVDIEEFERMIQEEELLEYAEYVGHYYGTSLKVIREYLDKGVDVILDIETQGASNVRKKIPEAVLIYIIPPSFEELVRRLRNRGTDTEETIQKRLQKTKEEFRQIPNYDYIVINNQIETATEELLSIITATGCRVRNRIEYIEKEILSYDALS